MSRIRIGDTDVDIPFGGNEEEKVAWTALDGEVTISDSQFFPSFEDPQMILSY
jgi:hypothetical protein